MPLGFRRLSLLALCVSSAAFADFTISPDNAGWIPEYQQLTLRGGYEMFRSDANYDSGGALFNTAIGGQPVTLVDNRFRLAAEYGIAQDWSLGLKGGFSSESAGPSSGSGLSDLEFALKWNVKVLDPIVTFEVYSHVPLAGLGAGANDLVVTDGAVDVGGRLYTGHHLGRVLFSIAPGFVYRSKDYSPLFTVDGLVRYEFTRGYLQAIGNFVYAIDNARAPFNSAPDKPDAVGAGGSFLHLNGAPTGFTLGGGIGLKVYEQWMIEAAGSHTIYGQRYPSSFNVYVGVRTLVDFFKPIKPKRVKEVPFEEDDSKS